MFLGSTAGEALCSPMMTSESHWVFRGGTRGARHAAAPRFPGQGGGAQLRDSSRGAFPSAVLARSLPSAPRCPLSVPAKPRNANHQRSAGVSCHALLRGIFPTCRSEPCLLRWQADSLPLSHQGSPLSLQIPSNGITITLLLVIKTV